MILDASGNCIENKKILLKTFLNTFFVILHNKTRAKDYIAWNQGVKAFKNQKPFQN